MTEPFYKYLGNSTFRISLDKDYILQAKIGPTLSAEKGYMICRATLRLEHEEDKNPASVVMPHGYLKEQEKNLGVSIESCLLDGLLENLFVAKPELKEFEKGIEAMFTAIKSDIGS